MAVYRDLLGTFTGTGTTMAAVTGSPYAPLKTGKLAAVTITLAATAATSLMEQLHVKLTNPMWGIPLYITVSGGGLRTAPAVPIPSVTVSCDLPVQLGSPITIEAMWNVTAVTPNVAIVGTFV